MSIISLVRPGTKRKILDGEFVHWVFAHTSRAEYLYTIVMSAPLWINAYRWELEALRAWAKARSKFTGELYVLDHIVPVTHTHVSGLTVPWNLQVVHWRVNGSKGNKWAPDQMGLFDEVPEPIRPHQSELRDLARA